MNSTTPARKRKIIVYSAVYAGLIVLGAVLVALKGLANLRPVYVVNVSVDLFAMLTGYVIFVAYDADAQKTGNDSQFFLWLLNTVFLALFTDLAAWMAEGVPGLILLSRIVNTLYYMCMPLASWFFWRYLKSFIPVSGRRGDLYTKIMDCGLILALAARVLNLFTGFYFTVDAAGVYSRGKGYLFSLVYALVTTVVCGKVILAFRKKLNTQQLVSLLLFVLTPAMAGAVTAFVYGLSVSYGIIMVVILMVYCSLNIEQGRQKEQVDRDLEMARSIQVNSLPRTFPPFPDRKEFDLYASMAPARAVGGDFYDFFMIDGDRLCLVIADVSGKGVPAALCMMSARTVLRGGAMTGKPPAELMTSANSILTASNTEDMFVTVWLGVLEISTGRLTAVNAGHEYPALKKAGGVFELVRDKHGLVMGSIDGIRYREYEMQLEPGDKLFVYTDGVPEATDRDYRLFGTERMIHALNLDGEASPEALIGNVAESIDRFVGGASQFDDITMLCLEYKG